MKELRLKKNAEKKPDTVKIAQTSHFSQSNPPKSGIIGILTAPFRKIADSSLFFRLQSEMTVTGWILVGAAALFLAFDIGALASRKKITEIWQPTQNCVADADELKIFLPLPVEYDESAESVSDKVFIDVPFFSQKDYPTGCELVSTSMLLAYYGYNIKADELITNGSIKQREVYLGSYDVAYGPDPEMYFVGDPFEDNGYGCYSGTIASALRNILPQEEYQVFNIKYWELDKICERFIDNGNPVLIWGGIDMKPTFFKEVNHWIIDEGERSGEDFNWRSNEHCLVLVGYDEDCYYFNDPLAKECGTKYLKSITKNRFEELGKMAVAVEKK